MSDNNMPERENPEDVAQFENDLKSLSINCSCDPPAARAPRRLFSSPPKQSAPAPIDNGPAADEAPFEIPVFHQPRNVRAEGMLRLEIPNFPNLRSKVSTPFQYIGNLPWRLAAKTEKTKRTSDVKFFSVYIDCNPGSESTLWSCEAVVEFRLLSRNRTQPQFSRQFTNKFNYYSNNWGFPSFMAWDEVNNTNFVRNDTVTVTARVVVQKLLGVRDVPSYDFGAMQTNMCDMTLVINNQRLFVNKAYLAMYSPVFSAMFFSNFQERENNQAELEDVALEEFRELLHVIYPSHKPVTIDNVDFLLELGDKYEIQYVMDECEGFLISTDEVPAITKLVWADQYLLANLQDSCLQKLTSVEEMKAIHRSEENKNLSEKTKAALWEKIMKILN